MTVGVVIALLDESMDTLLVEIVDGTEETKGKSQMSSPLKIIPGDIIDLRSGVTRVSEKITSSTAVHPAEVNIRRGKKDEVFAFVAVSPISVV